MSVLLQELMVFYYDLSILPLELRLKDFYMCGQTFVVGQEVVDAPLDISVFTLRSVNPLARSTACVC